MNPHELQKIVIKGGMSSMKFSWWCSCGDRRTDLRLGLDRTTGLGDWDATTLWAFTDHENHVRDSMKRAEGGPLPYTLNEQCPCVSIADVRCPLVQGHGGECFQ